MKKKFFRSIAHYLPQTLLFFSLLTSNILFPAVVMAQEISDIKDISQEETVPIDTSEDILKDGISTSIYDSTFENNIYTVNRVVEGEEYIYPENDNVRVKFTEVTQGGSLVIKRVELTQEQKELLNTKDNYGWDITSNMDNGTFKYDLTLPNIYDNTNVEVKYTEDGNNYNTIQTNSINNNRIVIEGLDHFTLFVIVDDGDSGYTDNGWSSHPSGYQGDHKWVTSTQTDKTATWTYTGGNIENGAIYLSWTIWDDHATNATYTSSLFPSDQTVNIDQKLYADQTTSGTNGTWSGWYRVPSTGSINILTNSTITLSPISGTNGNLSADAVAFVDLDEKPKEVWVDDNYTSQNNTGEHFWGYDAFSKIQEGINAVSSSGTVYVASGTYTENPNLNKSITLHFTGGQNQTIIYGTIYFSANGATIRGSYTIKGDTQKPTKPSNLSYTVNGKSLDCGSYTNTYNVTANWSASTDTESGVDHYEYQSFNPPNGWIWPDNNYGVSVSTAYREGSFTKGEGTYGFRVRAVDKAGNKSDWSSTDFNTSCQITYDNTTPSVPTGLYFWDVDNNKQVNCGGFSKTKHINEYWNLTDDVNFLRYEYSSFDAPNGNPGLVFKPLTTNYFDSSWWTIPMEGTYGFQVRTVDKAGNISQWSDRCNINIDWSAPTISNIQIQKNGTTAEYVKKGDTIVITADVIDSGSGVKAVSADFSYNYGYTTRPNPTSISMSKVGSTDIYKLEFTIPDGWNEGNLYITVAARDNLDNYNGNRSSAIKILNDNTKPSKPVITNSPNNAYSNVNSITINWSGGDDEGIVQSGIKGYILRYVFSPADGSGDINWSSGLREPGNPKTHWGTYGHGEGTYVIYLKTVDNAGNESEESNSFTITYDSTAPIANILSHKDGDWIKGTTNITGQITDVNLMRYWFVIQNTLGVQVGGYGTQTVYTSPISINYLWNTSLLPDGQYTIKLEARDLANNKTPNPVSYDPNIDSDSIDWVVVNVDNTAPNISGHSNITLTEGDTFPTDTVSLTDNYGISKVCGKGKDITNNIETSEICIDTDTTNLTGDQFELMNVIREQIKGWKGESFTTVDLSIIPAGQYQITYYAFDEAGNKGNEETFTITIADNIPTVLITAPTTQITQGSSVVLGATVTNGNSPFTYLWGGVCTGTEQKTTFTSASTGTYTCTVTITDADEDRVSSSIDITVTGGEVLGEATGPTEPTVKEATTTKTTTKKTTTTALTTTQDTETTPEVVDTSIEETSVLGATCENKKKVSGYVYIDKNKDEEMNNNEKGIKDVTLTIKYTDDQGNTKTEEVSTDEKGYWEVQLCSGKYSVVTDQNTLPKNIEIPETLSLTVSDNEKEVVFNIQALDTRNFWQKYWYLIVGGIAVILIAGTSIKNKKKEEV